MRKINIWVIVVVAMYTSSGFSQVGAFKPQELPPPPKGPVLSLEEFMTQVRQNNRAYLAAHGGAVGARKAARGANLVVSPNLSLSYGHTHDEKPSMVPTLFGSKTIGDQFSIGVAQAFVTGTTAKLSYSFLRSDVTGATPDPSATTGSPMIEITQSLWRNFWGNEVREKIVESEATALASSYGEGYRAKSILVAAEMNYWRLALARESVQVQILVLERAKLLLDWAERRARLNLSDASEALQARAAYQVRELELQQARDEERTAGRIFNTSREMASDEVKENLEPLNTTKVRGLEVPPRAKMREDILAAEQQRRLTQAQMNLARESVTPELDLFGSLALNSRETDFGKGLSNSFSTKNPTYIVGIKFTAPLNLGARQSASEGYTLKHEAAEREYQSKLFEQDQTWDRLVRELAEAKRRLELAESLQKAQEKKLAHERERLNRGRSTTFQVLQFEQDFATSHVGRIRAEAEVLRIAAEMKLYGEVE